MQFAGIPASEPGVSPGRGFGSARPTEDCTRDVEEECDSRQDFLSASRCFQSADNAWARALHRADDRRPAVLHGHLSCRCAPPTPPLKGAPHLSPALPTGVLCFSEFGKDLHDNQVPLGPTAWLLHLQSQPPAPHMCMRFESSELLGAASCFLGKDNGDQGHS